MGIRIIANSRFDYILIKNESFNLSKILQEMKDKIRQKKYDEYQVSISELNELKLLEEDDILNQALMLTHGGFSHLIE